MSDAAGRDVLRLRDRDAIEAFLTRKWSIELHYRVRSTRREHELTIDVSTEGDGLQ